MDLSQPVQTSAIEIFRQLISPKRSALVGKAAWVTGPFVVSQFIRLASNVILAWLLAPQLLGMMLLINTLRTGAELLTDVGVGQSIVSHARGGEPDFYNTAWTIQIVRGILLFSLALLLTVPIARIYDNENFIYLLPAMAPIFLLTGFTSPARFILQKRLEVRTQALFDLTISILGTIILIALAWSMQNIWALVLGALIATGMAMIGSYLIMDWRTLRLQFDRESVLSIISFGKWIFLSSLIYFLAMNFDKLFLADVVSFAILGVYGISRTFADTLMLLFSRISQMLVFPIVSSAADRGEELRRQIIPIRFAVLACVATALAFAIGLADVFINLVYDERYENSGIILTILLFGTWFGVLATMSDAIMMGLSKPAGVATANAAKLIVIALGLPLTISRFGFSCCLIVLILAESVRYAVLMVGKRRSGMGFTRQDIAITLYFFCLAFVFREISMAAGVTEGVQGWMTQLDALDG